MIISIKYLHNLIKSVYHIEQQSKMKTNILIFKISLSQCVH